MKRNGRIYLVIGFFIAFTAALQFGAGPWGLVEFAQAFLHDHYPDRDLILEIFFDLRFLRALAAIICGAALGAAGVLSQGLFRNPLASPEVFGVNAGAALCGAAAVAFGLQSLGLWLLPVFCFVGAGSVALFIIVMHSVLRVVELPRLLLCGFAISSLCGALSALMHNVVLEEADKLGALIHWLLGGLQGFVAEKLVYLFPTFTVGMGLAIAAARYLDVLSLGEDVAATLSVSLNRVKLLCICAITLLLGGVVAVAGPIAFVSLVVPHITRMQIGPAHRSLLVWSAVNGATLLLLADLLGRIVMRPAEIHVGVVSAALGAPYFLMLLLRSSKKRGQPS